MASKKKVKVQRPVVRVRTSAIISEAIDNGIHLGLSRARKHTDTPDDDTLKEQISMAVYDAICEYFDFDTD